MGEAVKLRTICNNQHVSGRFWDEFTQSYLNTTTAYNLFKAGVERAQRRAAFVESLRQG